MADRWRVLQLIGIDDSRTITVTYLSQRRDRMRFDCLGNVELSSLVDPTRFELVPFLCGPVKGEPVRVQCDVILNVICDPDTNAGSAGDRPTDLQPARRRGDQPSRSGARLEP